MKFYKILLLILISLFFLNCTTIYKRSNYYPTENMKYIGFIGEIQDEEDETSVLSHISIYDRRDWNREIKFLSKSIKIIVNNKEYVIPYDEKRSYKSRIIIYVDKLNIVDEDFIAYLGKVRLDTGEVYDIPPLLFKKEVIVESYNPILDALNQITNKRIFEGLVADYKKQKEAKKKR